MSIKSFCKIGLTMAGIVLIAACTKTPHSADGSDDGLSARGLGQMGGFAGQVDGEMYTTKAPHNQIYLFAYDNSGLNEKYVPSVNAQAEYLKSHNGARILIAGHTDERGSREYNVALGERRANSVADLMRMSGVSHQQYRVVSYGKERPACIGHDDECHGKNRRVVLTYEATQ